MKKYTLILALLFLTSSVAGQEKINFDHSKSELDCKVCHTCDTPTKSNPCLAKCPRNLIVTAYNSPDEAPEEIVIDKLKNQPDLYEPVKFPHKAHAEMAEMDGGCTFCHHYTPNGKITPCYDCHEVDRKKSSISRPDLKAAYHRECLSCHRDWSGSNDCNSCHVLKSSLAKNKPIDAIPVRDSIHTKEPEKIVYETDNDDDPVVTFFHSNHSNRYGLQCKDCHQETACVECHSVAKKEKGLTSMKGDDPHDKCASCHDTDDNCELCHSTQEKESFNHLKETGFALGKFHNALSCIVCHGKGKGFKNLSTACNSCHGKWDETNFDHRVTGFELSEDHIDFYCENCHINRNFAAKPSCVECHEDEVSFPSDLPGKYIKQKTK